MSSVLTQLTYKQLTHLAEGLSAFTSTSVSDTSIALHLTYAEHPPADQLVISGTGLVFAAGVITSGTITSIEFKLADASIAKISDVTLSASAVTDLLGNNKSFEHYLEHVNSLAAPVHADGSHSTVGETVFTGEGNHKVAGTEGDDFVSGGSGKDHMAGGAGNDVLMGGAGNDDLSGGVGDDVLDGGTGNDVLNGGTGNNTLSGGAGNDKITADGGDDVLDGGTGDDAIVAGDGNNSVDGGDGNDKITSGSGADIINGGTGNDKISSGDGNDTDNGGTGDDVINAGAGDDILDGGVGADKMAGGTGNDTYYVDNVGDKITEKATQGIDTVVSSISFSLEKDKAVENLTLAETASPLNIDATGNGEANILIGNSGDNVLNGKTGADTLTGGAGHDIFVFDNMAKGGADTVTDFHSGEDLLALGGKLSSHFVGGVHADNLVMGTSATHTSDHLIFDSNTGHLFYDADGVGGKEQVLLVTLTGVSTLHATDFSIVA